MAFSILGFGAIGLLQASADAPPPTTAPVPANNAYALLVGCSKYLHLPARYQLQGPANDVVLLRSLLVERFHFPDKNIVTLSEAEGQQNQDLLPARANIKREFDALAAKAKQGDQVVILLSGHGSQQPDQEPFDELDGLDETFLPRDAGPWDGSAGVVKNAIIDDELGVWVKQVTDHGASLWIIIDACHSGTMLRGANGEVAREVPAAYLVPEEAIKKAKERAKQLFGMTRGTEEKCPLKIPSNLERIAAVYAAQSHEVTVEKPLPADSPDAKPYGLLTYTLCQMLSKPATSKLTYRELVQRIDDIYKASNRPFPTPLVEGKDQDRQVLGLSVWPARPRIRLVENKKGGYRLNAGALQGLTTGTILAVHPASEESATNKPAGYVRITAVRALTAEVQPHAYDGLPASRTLPTTAYCRPAYIHYGDRFFRLRLATDVVKSAAGSEDAPARRILQEVLQKLAAESGSLVEVVKDARLADWLVRVSGENFYLMPAQGVKLRGDTTGDPLASLVPDAQRVPETPLLGPFRAERLLPELKENLQRIARVHLLKSLALAAPAEQLGRSRAGVNLDLQLLRLKDRHDKDGQPVQREKGSLTLREGDLIAFRVKNVSEAADIYVTLLFLDSGYGIYALYPRGGELAERLPAGKSFQTVAIKVTSNTLGVEHLVAIAVKAEGPPIDFTLLEQPTILRARGVSKTRGGPDPLETPLGKLFHDALYGQSSERGASRIAVENYRLCLESWQTLPGKLRDSP